jgi:hypothetical protein
MPFTNLASHRLNVQKQRSGGIGMGGGCTRYIVNTVYHRFNMELDLQSSFGLHVT